MDQAMVQLPGREFCPSLVFGGFAVLARKAIFRQAAEKLA